MPSQKQIDMLTFGAVYWNRWRQEKPDAKVKLAEADLAYVKAPGVNFRGVDLRGADLLKADLRWADLTGADLSLARITGADLSGANLTDCRIHGISAWNVNLTGAIQSNLIITRANEPLITVDNLEVAQFVYLLLNNEKIREVINTISSKVVLILGRFTPERKAVLDALREELRDHDLLPILFDFERPTQRDLTETVRTLAHLSKFIIADLTEPKSIPQELQAIVPDLAVPVVPIIEGTSREYGMFRDFRKYRWVLDIYHYESGATLLQNVEDHIIGPAQQKARELHME